MDHSAEVWAFANQKGGCGKTTTAVNLAAALARAEDRPGSRTEEALGIGGSAELAGADRRRVLLIDLDPQAHATLALGHAVVDGPSIAQVFLDEAPLSSVIQQVAGGLHLAPASLELGDFEAVAERRLEPERALARAIGALRDRYDWILLDCPPRADGVLTANAIRAASTVCLVVETGPFSLQGALRARKLLQAMGEDGGPTPDFRVVATLFDRRVRLGRDILVAMQARFGSALFDTAIRESVRLREAAAFGVPVSELDPNSRAAADFEALAREIRVLRPHVLTPSLLAPLSPNPDRLQPTPPL